MRPLILILMIIVLPLVCEAREVVMYSHLTNGYWQIWMMNPDGSHPEQVTSSPQDKRDANWTMNSHKIVFRNNNSQVFLYDLKNKTEEEILSKLGNITNPYFLSNEEMVFVRFELRSKDISDIWRSDINGDNTRILTKDNEAKFQPSVSWQKDKVVFVKSDKATKSFHLWMMDPDGSKQLQLTKGGMLDNHPSFSADGKTILFSSNRTNNYDVYMLNIASKEIRQLTDYSGLDTSPVFSKDSKTIFFVSNRSGNQQIWSMNPDGLELRQLTKQDGESIDPRFGEIDE